MTGWPLGNEGINQPLHWYIEWGWNFPHSLRVGPARWLRNLTGVDGNLTGVDGNLTGVDGLSRSKAGEKDHFSRSETPAAIRRVETLRFKLWNRGYENCWEVILFPELPRNILINNRWNHQSIMLKSINKCMESMKVICCTFKRLRRNPTNL